MIGKIQTSFLQMGEKYEEFIESHVIDSIDHVNKMTQEYHEKIEELKKQQVNIWHNVQKIKLEVAIDQQNKKSVQSCSHFGGDLIGISLPNIRIVQTISVQNVREDRKKNSLNGLKEHVRQQHKQAVFMSQSLSTHNSENVTPNLFESFDHTASQSSNAQIFFDKGTY